MLLYLYLECDRMFKAVEFGSALNKLLELHSMCTGTAQFQRIDPTITE